MPENENQTPIVPSIGGHGGGTDPCSSYTPIVCGSVSTTKADYAVYFVNPTTLRDSNGCFMFNGCYLQFEGHYYYWSGQTAGYVIVSPNFGSGGGSGKTKVWKATGQDFYLDLQNHNYTGAYVRLNADSFTITTEPGGPPGTDSYSGGGGGDGGGGSGGGSGGGTGIDLVTALSWIPPVISTFNAATGGIGEGLTKALLAGNGPILEAINKLLSQGGGGEGINPAQWQNFLDNLGTQLTQEFINAASVLQNSNQQAIVEITDKVSDLVDVAIGSVGAQAKITDPTQLDYNNAGKAAFDAFTHAIMNPNGKSWTENFIDELKVNFPFPSLGLDSINDKLKVYGQVTEYLLSGNFHSWSEFKTVLEALAGTNDILFLAIDLFALATIIVRSGVIRAEPIAEELSQLSMADNPVKLLDNGNLFEGYRRGHYSEDAVKEELKKQGLNDDRILTLLGNANTLPPLGIVEEATLRRQITPEQAVLWLQQNGFDDRAIDAIVSLYNKIPPPTDITRIADKRIWSQQTSPVYGQYSELPPEYVDYMKQWGYEEKFTEWLWAAHWNLPSPNQIFDMLHRGVINQGDIETYLGLTDWLPFFRDKLVDISYNVLTRVDVRRMLHAGIIDFNEAVHQHEKQGYTHDDAVNLGKLDLATATTDPDTMLTKIKAKVQGFVESAYAKGTISRDEAFNHLTALELPGASVNLLLDVLEHERQLLHAPDKTQQHMQAAEQMVLHAFSKGTLGYTDATEYLATIGMSHEQAVNELRIVEIERVAHLKEKYAIAAVKLYGEHTIEYPGFTALLGSQGFSGTEIDQLAQEAELQRLLRTKRPSEVEYKQAAKKNIIDKQGFFVGMKGLGYHDEYLEFLWQVAVS